MKRSDALLLAAYGVAILALVFPVVPAAWSGVSSFLAMPRAFVWVIFWLVWVFAAVFLHDRHLRSRSTGGSKER